MLLLSGSLVPQFIVAILVYFVRRRLLERETMADHRTTQSRLLNCSVCVNVLLLCTLLVASSILLALKDNDQSKSCGGPVDEVDRRGQEVRSKLTRGRYCYVERRDRCLEQGKQVKVQQNRSLCCGDLGDRLYVVMAEAMRQTLQLDAMRAVRLGRVKRYIQQLQLNSSTVALRVAAHVGISSENFTDSVENLPRIQWERDGDRSFVSGGLIHMGNRLVITTAGYYYVYSGLQYDVDPATTDNSPLVAFLYRHVNGTRSSQRKLLTARESSCQETRGFKPGPVSMHMAGIFLLHEHDEISVLTHSLDLLTRSPTTTYLGIHMV